MFSLSGIATSRRAAAVSLLVFVAALFPIVGSTAGEYMLLSPWSGPPGSTVEVTGYAFGAGAAVHVTFQGAAKDVVADSGGGFTTSFTVPMRPGGSYTLNATAPGSSAQANFYIEGQFPSALPNDWWVMPGQSFGVIATSFAPGEKINIFRGSESQPSSFVTAGTNGNVSTTTGIKALASFAGQSMTVRLVGEESGASAAFSVTVGGFYAHASPSAYYATPGQVIGVSGGGFADGETVDIRSGAALVTSVVTDGEGNFNKLDAITMAFGTAGGRTFQVVGQTSGGSAEFTVELGGLFPSAVPSEYFALPGTKVGVVATGFLPGEPVELQTQAGTVVATATAGAGGSVPGWTQVITVPYGSAGNLTYRVMGVTSGASTTFGFSVGGFDPQLDPSDWYVAPRKLMSAVGRGFAPGETVNISVNGTNVRQVIANGEGNFTASVRAPASGESFLLKATGVQSTGSAEREIGLNVACMVEEEEA